MFIPVHPKLMRSQDYDVCLRAACDHLYRHGINNFIHYRRDNNQIFDAADRYLFRVVELTDTHTYLVPTVDQCHGGIELLELSL